MNINYKLIEKRHVEDVNGDVLLLEHIKRAETVNMEMAGFNINIVGSFDGSDATFDLNRNVLRVSAYAKPVLRDCLIKPVGLHHNAVIHAADTARNNCGAVERGKSVFVRQGLYLLHLVLP